MASSERPNDGDSSRPPVDGSTFVGLLGDNARAEVLAAMVRDRDQELSVAEVEERTGTAENWVRKNLNSLVEYGVVEETRRIGRAQLYQLNAESEIAERLIELYETVRHSADQ